MKLLWLLSACPKPPDPASAEIERLIPPGLMEYEPAGVIEERHFRDLDHPWEIGVPTNWIVSIGDRKGEERLHLREAASGAELTVRVYPGEDLEPRKRDGCQWHFRDQGPYGLLNGAARTEVSSCSPLTAEALRVLGWYSYAPPMSYHIEVTIPNSYLLSILEEMELLLQTVLFQIELPSGLPGVLPE